MPLPDERARGSVANLIGRFEKHERQNSGSDEQSPKPTFSNVSNSPFLRTAGVNSNAASPAPSGPSSAASSPLKERQASNGVLASPAKDKTSAEANATPSMSAPVTDVTAAQPPQTQQDMDPFVAPSKSEAQTFVVNSSSTKSEPPKETPAMAFRGPAAVTTKTTTGQSTSAKPVKPAATSSSSHRPPTASASALQPSVTKASANAPTATKSDFTKPAVSSIASKNASGGLTRVRSTPSLKAKAKTDAGAAPPPVPPLKAQHTGNGTTSRRPIAPPPPPPVSSSTEAPRRAKTPSTSTFKHTKVPSSGSTSHLYAPTASSLARAQAAAEAKVGASTLSSSTSAPTRRTIAVSSSSSHIMAPTAASLARSAQSSRNLATASGNNAPLKSSASASGSRRVLVSAVKAVPAVPKARTASFNTTLTAKVSKHVLNGMQVSKTSDPPTVPPNDAHPDIEDTKAAEFTPQAAQEVTDPSREASIVEEPEVLVEVEAEAITPAASEPVSEAHDETTEWHQHEEQPSTASLEHVVAMLENTGVPPFKHRFVADATATPATELEKERTFETGGYEDDNEDIPDIPDAD